MDVRPLDRRHALLISFCVGLGVLALVLLAALLGGVVAGAGTRSCPFTRTAAGDYVPAGPRPCTLYGTSHGGTGVANTNHSWSSGHGSARQPARPMTPKTPGAKAPVAKVPAAPPKAPAAPPKAPAAPRVRLTK